MRTRDTYLNKSSDFLLNPVCIMLIYIVLLCCFISNFQKKFHSNINQHLKTCRTQQNLTIQCSIYTFELCPVDLCQNLFLGRIYTNIRFKNSVSLCLSLSLSLSACVYVRACARARERERERDVVIQSPQVM